MTSQTSKEINVPLYDDYMVLERTQDKLLRQFDRSDKSVKEVEIVKMEKPALISTVVSRGMLKNSALQFAKKLGEDWGSTIRVFLWVTYFRSLVQMVENVQADERLLHDYVKKKFTETEEKLDQIVSVLSPRPENVITNILEIANTEGRTLDKMLASISESGSELLVLPTPLFELNPAHTTMEPELVALFEGLPTNISFLFIPTHLNTEESYIDLPSENAEEDVQKYEPHTTESEQLGVGKDERALIIIEKPELINSTLSSAVRFLSSNMKTKVVAMIDSDSLASVMRNINLSEQEEVEKKNIAEKYWIDKLSEAKDELESYFERIEVESKIGVPDVEVKKQIDQYDPGYILISVNAESLSPSEGIMKIIYSQFSNRKTFVIRG